MDHLWRNQTTHFGVVFVDLSVLHHLLCVEARQIENETVPINTDRPLLATRTAILFLLLLLTVIIISLFLHGLDSRGQSVEGVCGELDLLQQSHNVGQHGVFGGV